MALVTSPIPGVAGYEGAAALALKAYGNAKVKSNQNIQTSLRQFGYGANVDPESGQLSGLHVDAMNPYGQYQSNLRTHAQQYGQMQNAQEGRHIYGGLANQGVTDARYGFGADANQLGEQVTGAIQDHANEIAQAGYDYNSALYSAEQDSARTAAENQTFNTAGKSGNNTQPTVAQQNQAGPITPKHVVPFFDENGKPITEAAWNKKYSTSKLKTFKSEGVTFDLKNGKWVARKRGK